MDKKKKLFVTVLGAGVPVKWLLRDEFTDTVAAGSVNATTATPTGGARTVTDTNSKISVGSGVLDFATGEAVNDGIWYAAMSRVAGKVVVIDITVSATARLRAGWDANQAGGITGGVEMQNPGRINIIAGATTISDVGVYADGTTYKLAMILRALGSLVFVKGGAYTTWTLLWTTNATNDATVYPGLSLANAVSIFTSSFIRVPDELVSFAPLASDSFNRADAAIGTADGAGSEETAPATAWTGATYTIVSNKAINTPTLGAELATGTLTVGT